MEIKDQLLIKMVKELGEAQAGKDAEAGAKQRQYRKKRNATQNLLLELAKSDPRFQEKAKVEIDRQFGRKAG